MAIDYPKRSLSSSLCFLRMASIFSSFLVINQKSTRKYKKALGNSTEKSIKKRKDSDFYRYFRFLVFLQLNHQQLLAVVPVPQVGDYPEYKADESEEGEQAY